MNREELTALGLTDEQVDAVLKSHGKSIQKYKNIEDQLNQVTEDKNALTAQLEDGTKQIKSLTKKAASVDDLTKQLEQTKGQLTQNKRDTALNGALTAAKVRNPKALRGFLDMDKVQFDDDGKLTGLDEQIKGIKESDPYLFDEGTHTDYQPAGGDPAPKDSTQAMVDVFKQK